MLHGGYPKIFVTDGVEAFHFLHILTSTCQLPTTKQKENKFQWGEPEAVQPPVPMEDSRVAKVSIRQLSHKLITELLSDPGTLLLSVYPKEWKMYIKSKTCLLSL